MPAIPVNVASVSRVSGNKGRGDVGFFFAFITCLVILASVSLYFFPHVIEGDAVGYINAMQVFAGGQPTNLADGAMTMTITLHRILTTPLSVEALRVFSGLLGSIKAGWLLWDAIMFFASSIVFYQLLARMFRSSRVAFLGGLFFAGNYSMIAHGLGFFVDIGGWFFYVLSVFCLFVYIESGKYRDLLFTTFAIAVGSLFKENALVAVIPLTAILFYENYPSPVNFLKRIVPLGFIVAVPMITHYMFIYLRYGYSYLYWIRLSHESVHYTSRLVEYIKSLGSLLTFLAPVALLGVYALARPTEASRVETKKIVFISSVIASSIPALLWPGITQRVLFMVVPGAVLLAGVFIKKHERYWWVFLPVVLLYVLASFFMDSFILNFVNLPF